MKVGVDVGVLGFVTYYYSNLVQSLSPENENALSGQISRLSVIKEETNGSRPKSELAADAGQATQPASTHTNNQQ